MPGTPKVGYMPPVYGGFRCGNCDHYKEKDNGSGCNQKEVIAELGAGRAGLAAVDESGCCNEFDPKKTTANDPGMRMLSIVQGRKNKQ